MKINYYLYNELEGTGLLSILGIEKFQEILGMDYKDRCYSCLGRGLSVVFVIDDTESMGGELIEATQYSVDIVNQAILLGSNGPSNFILSTINDPGITKTKTCLSLSFFFCLYVKINKNSMKQIRLSERLRVDQSFCNGCET